MLCQVCLVLMCVLAFTTEVYNNPIAQRGSWQCIQQGCPQNTIACATVSTMSEDKKNIINKTQCFGTAGTVLHNITTTHKNPFGPDVYYQGFKYSGSYGSITTNTKTKNKVPNNDSSEKEGNQEVDDLNHEVEAV